MANGDMGIGILLNGDARNFVSSADKATKSLGRLGTATKGSADSMSKFYDKTRKTNNALNNIAKDANRSAEGLGKMGKAMNQMAGATGVYMLANALSKAVQSSMDMIETVNLFSVSMGDMAMEGQKFVTEMSGAFGFDQTNIQSAVGNFNLLARSMGFSTTQAEVLSTNTYKLGKDLASLTNVPINQVMQDLRSGLIGQSETVYKYGMDLTEASLGAEAVAQGIDKSVRSMSQGEKMALRYSLMLKQSTLAQGDFSRTIDSPANQLKVLSERFVTLGRSIGSMFIPLLTSILPYLNAFVKTITGIFNTIATFFGYEAPEVSDMSGSFSGIEDGADASTDAVDDTTKAIKEMKTATLGIDELNLIPDTSASDSSKKKDGAGGAGASILPDFELPSYDDLMSTVKNKSDEIAKNMKKVWDSFVELSKPLIFANWESLKYSVGELGKALGNLGKIAFGALIWFYKEVLVPIGVWLIEKGLPAFVNVLASAFQAVCDILIALAPAGASFFDKVIKPLGELIGTVIIDTLNGIAGALRGISDWATNNGEQVRDVAEIIGTFMVAWKVTQLLAFIQMSGGVVSALTNITKAIKLATLAKVIDKLETMYLTALYAKDFVVAIGRFIGMKAKEAVAWVGGTALKVADALAVGAMAVANGIYTIGVGIATGATWLFNGALAVLTSPIFLVILALGALIAVGYLIVKNWDWITATATNVGNTIRNAFGSLANWMQKNVADPLTRMWDNMWGGVWNGTKYAINGIIGLLNGMINGMGALIGGIVVGINKMILAFSMAKSAMGIEGWVYPISFSTGMPNIPYLARGGQLNAGQAFVAGEAGAEMIGNYEGKTTVMPLENTGFVQAIHDAVLSAMTKSGGENGKVIENVVNLDGQVIYANQQKVASKRGNNFGMGVFAR
jgi:methyl-accepting chemotaxis protein